MIRKKGAFIRGRVTSKSKTKLLFNREIKKSTYRSALSKMPILLAGKGYVVLNVMF